MKGYSIKYLETRGIVERDGVQSSCGTYLHNEDRAARSSFFERIDHDIFLNRGDAISHGKEKLQRKIVSLRKKIIKLKKQIHSLS